ncbi:hypothetical protein BDV93DRAFT_562379 [Ceratobasidium sp. AG-I]|nr:hypothetical protein BDV93DRAFT_562379 [Ceratobasidium sp. AG-I]
MGEQTYATTTKGGSDVVVTDCSTTSSSRSHASPRPMLAWKSLFGLARTHTRHNPTLSIENAFFLVNQGLAAAGPSRKDLPATIPHDHGGKLLANGIENASSGSFILSTKSHSGSIEDSDEYFFTPRSTIELPAHDSNLQPNFQCPPSSGTLGPFPWILESYRRVDSPTPVGIHGEGDDTAFTLGELNEAKLLDICNGVRRFTHNSISTSAGSLCPDGSAGEHVAQDNISRKILVIGSNYNSRPRRTFSISSDITLEGAVSDKNIIKDTFAQRGYSGHSMVNDTFDQEAALDEVSRFLSTAHCGDVRAIVFTGHAISAVHDPGPALVPPNCPARELAIPAHVWEQTILNSAEAGVVVLSIFASCFSGGFMQQPINMQNLDVIPDDAPGTYPPAGPILITFSSTSPNQLSYESSIEDKDPWRVADHFLHALSRTAQSPLVNDWASFVSTLESEFQAARDIGSSFDPDRTLEEWQADSPQTPMLTASSLPNFPTLFPELRRAPHSYPT